MTVAIIRSRIFLPLFASAAAAAMVAHAGPCPAAPAIPAEPAGDVLTVIAALDTAVFDAFNNCSDPDQLQRHANYFDANVEFYHDTGGVTWNRQDMIANTAKYVCGNFRRELVPGSLDVYPIKNFGAIAQGTHRFCQFKSGACEGMADFAIVWRLQDGSWQITRVLSYGHRAAAATAATAATAAAQR